MNDIFAEFDRKSTIKNINERLNLGELRVDNSYISKICCKKYKETYTIKCIKFKIDILNR